MPFTKGNQFGRGRPKISLNKPELLLPIIFQKAHINWANDFCLLYKKFKTLTSKPNEKDKVAYEQYLADKIRFGMYLELMPYLCTKIALKDLDASKFVTEKDKKAMTDQTEALIKALEHDTKSNRTSQTPSMENGASKIPPTA